MANATGGAGDLLPKGETLRRAMKWLDDRAQEEPHLDRAKAVSEAALRFDLTPLEAEFLLRNWLSRRP